MKEYKIYIRSNEHPRTINTPMMARTYYSIIRFCGTFEEMVAKVKNLKENNELVYEIHSSLNERWLDSELTKYFKE